MQKEEELVILCGHYEGIDERALERIVTDYVSIGDYVLTGGELPAMIMIDVIARLLPGVLHNGESAQTESFENDLLEYPQYTRPEVFEGVSVPKVLLSGHHANVDEWRLKQSIERTKSIDQIYIINIWKGEVKHSSMEQNTHFIGRAIIDESLNILTADTKLSKYLGNNAMYTLARSIHPNDINRLEDGLKVVSIEQSTIISLRMVDDNGRYQWVIMLLVDIPKNRNHDRQIRIELHDIAEVKSLHIAEDENYMQYFSLMEHLMFSYDIYTDKLKIFMMGNQQQVNFYNGTLTDWEKQ